MSLPLAQGWNWMTFKFPSNPNHPVVLWFCQFAQKINEVSYNSGYALNSRTCLISILAYSWCSFSLKSVNFILYFKICFKNFITVRQCQYESKFYSQVKSVKIFIPYREINAAAGANSSAPRCAYIILWMIPAVKGGWAQSCQMLSVTCISVRSFPCSDGWGVNDKIMEQRKRIFTGSACNDTAMMDF